MCGIQIEVSYLTRKGVDLPNPKPSPLSPIKPPTMCDNYYFHMESNTYCCMYDSEGYYYAWCWCPLNYAIYYTNRYSCFPTNHLI